MHLYDLKTWKSLAHRMLIVSRFLIVSTLLWDFVVTAVYHSSMKATVLASLGIAAMPIVTIWLISIIGLSILLLVSAYGSPEVEEKTTLVAHICLGINLVIYGLFLALGIPDPSISVPIILNYITNMMWIVSLIYFRIKLTDKNLQ